MSIKVALEHYTGVSSSLVRSRCSRTSSGCGRRRTRARRSRRTRSRSAPKSTSSTGSRIRSATGSRGIVFPEKVSRLEITVGLVADMMVVNPLDFFIESYAERFPFELPAGPGGRPRAVPPAGRRERSRRRVDDGPPVAPRRRRADREVPRRPQSGGVPGCRVQPAHGGRRPDPRPHPRVGHRLVPRQCLAAREHPAPVRARRTLRVGVPRAARTRPRRTGRAGGPDRGLHRPARLGRGVRPRRRLDRPRPHERPLRR